MIDIYLCEDELSQLNYFKKVIESFLKENHIQAEIVSARNNPLFTINDFIKNEENTALFFLDVELNGYTMDGFGLARKLKKQDRDIYIVFLTSQEDLAFRAFEYKLEPLDYIIKKPEYFLSDRMGNEMKVRMENIFGKIELMKEKKQNSISISAGSRVLEVNKDDILFIQAVKGSHQIEIYLSYKKLTLRQSLKNISEMLDEAFIFISKSCIVQKQKIREIDKKGRKIFLECGYELEVPYREIGSLCKLMQGDGHYGLVVQ
ncbi:hypothetical protein C818_01630 [Lachnospiraceae bacterium MD308]|jgi:Response regulator of the LytR/AlgR family|nr:hypothetical protein C818_01630 [Lachnospiraceae bacterium MD308]